MTLEERLEKEVLDYCINNNRALVAGSIRCIGLDPDARLSAGELKPLYAVGFDVWVIKDESIQRNYAGIDPQTEKLVYILTPHQRIELEE